MPKKILNGIVVSDKGDKSITQSFRADGTQSKFVTRL